MSWRESLWAAAAVASTLKDQAQSTLNTAAAQVQQSYHEAANASSAAYSAVTQHDSDALSRASDATGHTRQDSSAADSSSLTSIAASFPSLTSISSSLPSSLSSLSLPNALSRLSGLADASSPNTAPVQSDPDDEQSEQLIPTAATANGGGESDVAVLTIDADDLELPSLTVNKTTLQTPVKLPHVNDSDEAPSLYYTPQQHKAKQQRDQLLHSSNSSNNHRTSHSPSPSADAHLTSAQHSTAQLFRAQDTVLHSMSSSIARLGELSADIGREVGEHEAMLSEVGDGMGVSEGLMDTSRKKIAVLLSGAPRYHWYLIGGMCLIVVVLLYAILYT